MINNKEKIKYHLDVNQEYIIKFYWDKPTDYVIRFKIAETIYILEDNKPKFVHYEMGNGFEDIQDCKIEDFDKYYSEINSLGEGFIKWDGCMEFYNASHHFCGYNNILDRIIKDIYINTAELMGDKFDKNMANFNNINKENEKF